MKQVKGSATYSQRELEKYFESIFDSFSINPELAEKMKSLLWEEHFEKVNQSHFQRDTLISRLKSIESFLEQSYEDKLKGQISVEMWLQNKNKWETQKAEIHEQLNTLEVIGNDCVEKGVELIELMQNVGIIYKSASPETKRRLVELVSSNLFLGDASMRFKIKKPFDLLSQMASIEIWYSQGDSNPCYRREKAMS
jgi:hypothetical protein